MITFNKNSLFSLELILLYFLGLRKEEQRKKFFDELAKAKNFSPLDAEKWYSVTTREVQRAVSINDATSEESHLQSQGGGGVLDYYGGSVYKAITSLYPEIVITGKKFQAKRVTLFNNLSESRPNIGISAGFRKAPRRRAFFDEFAKGKQFDPLDTDAWYSVSQRDVLRAVSSLLLL
jgi:hypothetical protein